MKLPLILLVFLLVCCYLLSNEYQYKYSKYTPYFPDFYKVEGIVESPIMKISYNIWLHNFDDALNHFAELDIYDSENYSFILMNIVDILDILYQQGKYEKLINKMDEWEELINYWDIKRDILRYNIVQMYYFNKINKSNLKSSVDNFNDFRDQTLMKNKMDLNYRQSESINYLALYYSEFVGNDSLAINLLEKSLNGFSDKRSILLKVKIIANEDVRNAIEFLNDELEHYFKNEYIQPMISYSNYIEDLRMFLAYLYAKVDDIDKAMENFKLAVTSKENGSTFMGDWDYWLTYRNYYKDEYEVMLKLKEMDLEKEKKN
ncbi:MAG: hypothetical protein Q7J16_12055 [Candidatus Cloacimonadales bacterium]|nr:hypothetical protein [Candidatus Cloacimonadales bacterium]